MDRMARIFAELPTWEVIAAAAAVAAGAWGHARSMMSWIIGLAIVKRRTDNDTAGLVLSYLAREGAALRGTPAYASNEHSFYVKPLGRVARVLWRDLKCSGGQQFWVRRIPLWFRKDKEDKQVGDEYPYVFSFIRGTLDWEALLITAMKWEDDVAANAGSQTRRFRVVRHYGKTLGGEIARQRSEEDGSSPGDKRWYGWGQAEGDVMLRWTPDDIGAPPTQSIDGLALMPQLIPVVEYARRWFKSRDWYAKRNLAWRLGMFFRGAPGTGKTTLARELAAEFDIPVHLMDLASMSNEDLGTAWAKAVADAPCMVVVEDIDRVFDGDQNIAPGGGMMSSGGLTFDSLLQCVDGIERHDGILFVVTTNHPDKVDDALNRKGRLDLDVEFVPLDHQRRLLAARQILDEAEAQRIADETDDMPASAFVKLCCDRALAKLYADVPKGGPYR